MNFLKWLLKREKYDIGIIRFGDSILIPGRDYFKESKDIVLLEEYKKHYLEELCKKKVITTLSFNSNKLKLDMIMNTDLILAILMNNDDFYLLASEELLIQSMKLRMYYEDICILEKETILRLVSLKEIEKNKRIPRYNKMALKEEINQLSVILEMYSYRKTAINIELKNYFDLLSTRDLSKEDTNILNSRLKKLLFITKGIIDNQEIEKYQNIKAKISFLERECERYAYQNKEEADKLKESYDLSDENRILLFYEYGKNYYDEEFMREFYLHKFNKLTLYINNEFEDSPFNREDYGFEYYKDIIAFEIEDIQNSYCFSKLKSEGTDIGELLNDAKRYLKNLYGEFDSEEILLNKYKLAFLVSLKYENGLKEFFTKNFVYKNNHSDFNDLINTCSKGIKWSDSFPLTSLFEFVDCESNHPLFNFYELDNEENNLLLPEGVEYVSFEHIPKFYIDRIKNDIINGKKYSTPCTLKRINGYIDLGTDSFNLLFLNDGLEYIGEEVFRFNANKISIPSSVEIICSIDKGCNIKTIEFRDFENSTILNDKYDFANFLSNFAIEVDTKKTKMHYPSADNLFIQERYREGYFSYPYNLTLLDDICIMYIYELGFSFEYVCFTSERLDEPIVIPASVLKIKFSKYDNFFNYRVGYPDYNDVYLKIRNILLENTGYDISNKEQVKVK